MKGVYLLGIEISETFKKKTGALGEIEFNPGVYAYAGSAQNNIEKRLSRHLSKNKKEFWHIDYLLDSADAEVKEIYVKRDASKEEECNLAKSIERVGIPIKGFGCSDCSCSSHLFKIDELSHLKQLKMEKINPESLRRS